MKCKVLFLEKALDFLNSLDKPIRVQIYNKLGKLEDNPELGVPLKNELRGSWRLHIGKYRVIYTIEGKDAIIAKIGHRKEVYE
ncbi:MAG: type II toxin-antitoxin system RelE/ParE family toxin [Candidatus Micrarchaeia archaeon]|jgi:mRNA-degrading endonuclease RelE of RelBE toxin-antitoxin system